LKSPASGGPDLPAIPCKKAGGRTVLQPRDGCVRPGRFSASQ
jgi:hypothetical protein